MGTGYKKSSSKPTKLANVSQSLRKFGRENVDALVQRLFKVVDKGGNVVPFKYQHGQARIASYLSQCEREGKPCRVYVLKSRQIGLTTLIANRNFVKILCNDNRRAVTMAHQEHRAAEILGKLKFAYANLPAQLKFELSQDSKSALGFADFNSKMLICSARNSELVRGDTYQDEHVSEFTRFVDQELALFELQQVCHRLPGTSIIIETTGKKYGSYAQKVWLQAKAGLVPYVPMFLPWQEDPSTDLDGGTWSDEERDRYMREVWDYEPQLIDRAKLYNLKPGCTYWAYLQLKEMCLGNFEQFLEDYPCSDEEAWRSKGDLFFESANIIRLLRKVETIPQTVFNLSVANLEDGFTSFAQLQEAPRHFDPRAGEPHLIVWRNAQIGRRYVCSGDSGMGTVGGDPSVSHVIDMYTGEMMAEFHGVIPPHQHARVMESLCRIYNDALAAPEVNSMGMATLQDLQRRYPYIFIWRALDDNKQRLSNKLGWYTGIKSRSLMLSLLRRVVDEAATENSATLGAIRSKGLLQEMQTFLENDNGKPEAAAGFHDDRIMSLAIAWYVSQLETRGMTDDILSVLRPVELEDAAPVKDLPVGKVVEYIQKQLRMGEYERYG